MKKLLLIGPTPPPAHGVTIYTQDLLKSNLNKTFIIVHLDSSDHRGTENYNKIDLTNIYLGIKNIFYLIYYLIVFRPNIVYCAPAPYLMPFLRESIFILLSKLLSRAKIVAHMHAGKYFNETFYEESNFLVRSLINNTLKMCDCGIVLGKSLIKHYKHFFKTTVYLWNGIKIQEQEPFKIEKTNSNKIHVGYLSNLCNAKGIITFIKAINSLPSDTMKKIRVKIVGDWIYGEEKTKNNFYKLLDKNKYSNKISIAGGLYSFQEKRKFYIDTDIFVFPTNMEAFGLVNIEAMYYGCAVISTKEGTIPEVVVDGKTGYLINKNDYKDLSYKLLTLIKSPREIAYFSEAGRRRVLDSFTLENNTDGLKNIFNSVLKK